jgi:hypothetical protein
MEKFPLLCAILFVTSCSAFAEEVAQHSVEKLEEEVEREFHGFIDTFRRLDPDGTSRKSFDQLEAIIISGLAPIEEIESLEFPSIHITVIDDNTIILIHEYEQMLLEDGFRVSDVGGCAQVWSKSSGMWKLVSVSANNGSAERVG